jgi:hypothetical protein
VVAMYLDEWMDNVHDRACRDSTGPCAWSGTQATAHTQDRAGAIGTKVVAEGVPSAETSEVRGEKF